MKTLMLLMMLADGTETAAPEVQLLDFSASYCGPCQQMVPVLQRMSRDKFPVRQIDITEEPELARRFRVERVPTLVLLVEGKEVRRFVGLTDEAELRREMNRAARQLAESRGQLPDNPARKVDEIAEQASDTRTVSADNEATRNPESDSSRENSERSSVGEILKGILTRGRPTPFEFPTVRAQSPEPAVPTDGLQAASAATVRVRVAGTRQKDGALVEDVGTGTIVYSAVGQAVILTCAHLFLDLKREGTVVEVEVFDGGNSTSYPGEIVGGSHDSDIALLKIKSSRIHPTVRLSSSTPAVEPGQPLVSFGCNEGANPTRLDTKVVDINRYNGPANLVCTTDPKSGRSGGGLFTVDGTLVGVCSCADRKRQEGLYMSHKPVLDLVKRLQLQSILMTPRSGSQETPAVGEDAAGTFAMLREGRDITATDPPAVSIPGTEITDIESPEFDVTDSLASADTPSSPATKTSPDLTKGDAGDRSAGDSTETNPAVTSSSAIEPSAAQGPELRIEINDRTPGARKRIIVIPQASPWMLELLTGEAALENGVATTALRPESRKPDVRSTETRKSTADRSRLAALQAP